MNIVKGRHPVVDALQRTHFVCNDCNMNQHKLWIITGPNMGGTYVRMCTHTHTSEYPWRSSMFSPPNSLLCHVTGKSTFLRQNALIIILAQVRTFVARLIVVYIQISIMRNSGFWSITAYRVGCMALWLVLHSSETLSAHHNLIHSCCYSLQENCQSVVLKY